MLKIEILLNIEYIKGKESYIFSIFDEFSIHKYKKEVNLSLINNNLHMQRIVNALDIKDKSYFTVMLMPKESRIGQYIGNGIAEWGYPDIFPSYQTVGIFHEFLHCLFEPVHDVVTDDSRWRLHGLIVLLADVYLRFLISPDDGFILPTVEAGYHERLVFETASHRPTFMEAIKNSDLSANHLLSLFDLPPITDQ